MEEQAEKILEKHLNEFDLNFIFHEKKELYNQLIDAVSEALNIHNVVLSEAEVCPDCGHKYEGTHDKGWHNKIMHGKDWQT